MKITYIKSKNTETIEVPELTEKIGSILSKYLDDDNELLFDSYVTGDRIEGDSEEIFLFMDEETSNNLVNFYRDYNLLIDYKDITMDVKIGKCDIKSFQEHFNKKEGCEFNYNLLETFLNTHMTRDDVLDKIYASGSESLTESEKKLL
jgi:hypothetical protein